MLWWAPKPPNAPKLGACSYCGSNYWTGGVCSWTGMPWKTTDRSTWATLNIYRGGMWWNFLFSFPAQDLLVVADGLDSRVAGDKGWFDLLDGFVQVPQMAPFGCLSKPAEWHAMLSVSDDQRSTFRAFLGSAHVHELWPVVTGVITHVALSVSSRSLTLVMNWQAGRRPEDSDYTVDVLSKCSGSKDSSGKKTMKFIPLKEHGEPVVISPPLP